MEGKHPLNIRLYTFCYNEIEILPFVVDSWSRYVTSAVVYDNMSTDGSAEFLRGHEWIEVREYDSDGKFDQDMIVRMKNAVWKECVADKAVDYVVVCDIDEVFRVKGFWEKIVEMRSQLVTMIYPTYHEAVAHKLPSWTPGVMPEDYPDVTCCRTNAQACMMFDPHRIQEVNYSLGHDGQTVSAPVGLLVRAYVADVLHLKLFGADRCASHLPELAKRFDGKNHSAYGSGRSDAATKMSALLLRKDVTVHNGCARKESVPAPSDYTGVKWEGAEMVGERRHPNKCLIVVPIYKGVLTSDEDLSLRQCVKVFGAEHDICICHPKSMYAGHYSYKYGHDFLFLGCADVYFRSQATYSWMCETAEWYKCFAGYEYMMIYQPDGWAFADDTDKFAAMGYGYYGAPWKSNMSAHIKQECCGNGGVSMRKVQTFIDACARADWSRISKHNVDYEDLAFSIDLKDLTNPCPVEVGMAFGFDAHPSYWFRRSGGVLPMCAHAWRKWEY